MYLCGDSGYISQRKTTSCQHGVFSLCSRMQLGSSACPCLLLICIVLMDCVINQLVAELGL